MDALTPAARRKALSDIATAGEIYGINYGCPDTVIEALDGLSAEGYAYVRTALDNLGGKVDREIERAFWGGYQRNTSR